jgi:hypothetical protein
VNLGWSDGGQGGLRATNAGREQVVRLLDTALAEGRLDAVAHAGRADAVRAAKTRGDLAKLAADLPDRRGVTDWVDDLRVRGDDRERAAGWLADGAAQGRLAAVEHERRVAALTGVETYGELKHVLHGLSGWPGAEHDDLLAGSDDRAAALAKLAEAVTDGRVAPVEAPALEADIGQARRVTDLSRLLAGIATRASDRERDGTAQELDAAYHDGRLDGAEHAARVGKARSATEDADLAGLVADLRGDTRRLAQADRDEMAARLKTALDEGRLDLAEYEERLRTANAATTVAETEALFADLVDPPKPARRGPLDALFDVVVFNSALMPASRRWWRYLYPKPMWKILTVGTLVAWIYTIFALPAIPLLAAVVVGWFPVIVLLGLTTYLAGKAGKGVEEREDAIARGIQEAVKRSHHGFETVEIDRSDGEVTFKVRLEDEGEGATIPEPVIEEAVRLLWISRLLLATIKFEVGWPEREVYVLKLNRAEWRRLTHRYGPRPYGPLPVD